MERKQDTKVFRFGDSNLQDDSLTKKSLKEYYDNFYAGSEFAYYDELTTKRFLRTFLRKCRIPIGASILDVGCATGFYTEQIRELGFRCVGIDLSSAGISRAHSKYPDLPFVVGDAAAMPFSLASFDALFMVGCSLTNTRDFHALQSYVVYLTRYIKDDGAVVLIGASNLTGEVSERSEWINHRYEELLQFVDRESVEVNGPHLTNLMLLAKLGGVVLNPISSVILRKFSNGKQLAVVYFIKKKAA